MKFNRNHILIVLLLTLFILGGIFGYQMLQKPKEENVGKPSESYEMEENNFNKILTGYVILEEKELPSREDFEKYSWDIPPESLLVRETHIYLKITEYTDEEFIKGIEKAIEQRNTINKKDGEDILFNLGCLENNKIKVDKIDTDDYMNEETRKVILESSEENPVRIILKLDTSEAHGCRCCSLAEKVRLY